MPDDGAPVVLHPVHTLRDTVERVLAAVRAELSDVVPDAEVEHVGATSLESGLTKGDVDVAVRVPSETFEEVVASLAQHFEHAQRENWTATYASFGDARHELPVGIQVSVAGSPDDFLVGLRDRFRADPEPRHRYDEVKRRAAPRGPVAYWRAKDAFLRPLVGRA